MSFLTDLLSAGTRAATRAVDAATSLGAGSMRVAAATGPGRLALDALLDRIDGAATLYDADERRAAFVALTTDSGAATIRETFAVAVAMAHLAVGDGGPLKRAIEAGIEDMRRLSASADMQELLPVPMVSGKLREQARLVVERAPERFLEALAPDGDDPQPSGIVAAALADADNLRVFLTVYPQILALIGADVGKVLIDGQVSFGELAAFMEGRRRVS